MPPTFVFNVCVNIFALLTFLLFCLRHTLAFKSWPAAASKLINNCHTKYCGS